MIDESYLQAIERRLNESTPGPWQAYIEGRDQESGEHFIMTAGEDIYLRGGATIADHDFIANCKQDIPALLAEIRRLKVAGQSDQ